MRLSPLIISNLISAIVTTVVLLAWSKAQLSGGRFNERILQESCACPCIVENNEEDDRPITYTTIDSPDWPSDQTWTDELGALLTADAHLYNNMNIADDEYLELCNKNATGFSFMTEGDGVCMIEPNCRYRFCNRDGEQVSAIAAYTVDVRSIADIQNAFAFANRYNIQVSVKTTGHNYAGSSAVGSSLSIWMINFPKSGFINTRFQDSCEGGERFTTVGVGGGELTNDVLEAVGEDYTLVTGDHRSVGFVGFVVGVGVSYVSRYYGAGVDLVKRFEVVLPNSTFVFADACTNPDLFWALRGGGGGTFGVITHMTYQLLPSEPITEVSFEVLDDTRQSVVEFVTWFTRVSPQADRRIAGGYWLPWQMVLYVVGDRNVAMEVIGNELEDWVVNTFTGNGTWELDRFSGGWFDVMGGREGYSDRLTDNPSGDGAGDDISTRLVPLDFILENPEAVANFIVDLYWEVENIDCYYFGQAMAEVAGSATAIHPAMREAAWAISTTKREGHRRVRNFLPNSVTGASYNHHSPEEPDWREALWGDNYPRLLAIKKAIDPSHRMNCWHCVGYQGSEYEFP